VARWLALLYGVAVYVLFLGTIVCMVGFVGDFGFPKTVDSGPAGPVMPAVLVNLGLVAIFGLQHSVMARPGFKRWWTRLVPEPVERSTFVLLASLALLVLFALWRPLPAEIWHVESGAGRAALWALYGAGWALVLVSTYAIDARDLSGLGQVGAYFRGEEYEPPEFQTPGPYRLVRHPLQAGFLLVFWATPRMTAGHLLLAGSITVYVLVGLWLEERDLVAAFGDRYRRYRQGTPMLVPGIGGRRAGGPAPSETVDDGPV